MNDTKKEVKEGSEKLVREAREVMKILKHKWDVQNAYYDGMWRGIVGTMAVVIAAWKTYRWWKK